MTDLAWQNVLALLETNEQRILKMTAAGPVCRVSFWRESPHRTLGHLTACQAAWLPLMRALSDGAWTSAVPIRPDPLFTKLGFGSWSWESLCERFSVDRREWIEILGRIDVAREAHTPTRIYSAQTLTRRMVMHEHSHLEQLPRED